MKRITHSAATAYLVAAMLCTVITPVQAAETQWLMNDGKWSFLMPDGSKARGWVNDGDCWYAFDNDGFMRTGWIASNEHWYFMGESGVMQSDAWVEDMGSWYFIKGTGIMAKDYVKDGYELTADGKAIPLNESNSLIITNSDNLEGKVIEGNLYIDASAAKEIELSGVTIKGKLVVIGDNITSGKVVVKDSVIETISNQTRGTEVILSENAAIKHIILEETADIKSDNKYKGEIDTFEIQSTVISDVNVEVAAHDVTTRTYAPIDIKAPVDNLEVIVNTEIKINEDVKNIKVDESAKDTKLDVAKGSVVGTIVADAPIKIDGKGTVNKVEANTDGVEAGEDTIIKEVEKGENVSNAPDENKPSGSGSSGGSYEPSATNSVSNEDELREALSKASNGSVITLSESFTIKNQINVENKSSFIIDGNNKTITFDKADPKSLDENNAYILHFYNNTNQVTVKNIKLTGSNAAILVNGANVKLTGTIDVSGNGFGGIEVSKGTDVTTSSQLDVSGAVLKNDSEIRTTNPTVWMDNYSTDSGSLTLVENSTQELHSRILGEKNQMHYYLNTMEHFANDETELFTAIDEMASGDTITLTDNITTNKNVEFNCDATLDIGEYELIINNGVGKISVAPRKKLIINGNGKITGAIYAESKFGTIGSSLVIDVGENFIVESHDELGKAINGNRACVLEIDGGTYFVEYPIKGHIVDFIGEKLTIKNAIINVKSESVMNAVGIYSNAKENLLENVTVNGQYSSAVNFNNETGSAVIVGGVYKTTATVLEGEKPFNAPTIRYRGALDISNAEITRVAVGIQYTKPSDKLEDLKMENITFLTSGSIYNNYNEIDYTEKLPPAEN